MKKKLSEIFRKPWGQDNVSCEPSRDEIKRAIDDNHFETREFQKDINELRTEWEKIACPERYEHIRQYHARRVAYFVKNGWHDPIVLKEDGREIEEGSHRLEAARYLDMNEVCVK